MEYGHSISQRVSPQFIDIRDGVVTARSQDEDIQVFNEVRTITPKCHLQIVDFSADVDIKAGRARVWVLLRVMGVPNGIERESVSPWSGAISDLAVFTNQNTKTLSAFMAICIAVIVGAHNNWEGRRYSSTRLST